MEIVPDDLNRDFTRTALAHLLRSTRPERAAKELRGIDRTSWSQHVLPSILRLFECPTDIPSIDTPRILLSFTGAAFRVESRLRRRCFCAPMLSTQSTPRIEPNSGRFHLLTRLSRVLVTAVTKA